MYDLGDSVAQQLTTRDAAGALADVTGTPVCTITLPDATTATPAVAHPSTGVYTISFPTTQAGRHVVRWVTTGPAQAQTDVFWVAPADPGAIIGLADARSALRLPAGTTIGDEDLRELIVAASFLMDDLCGPVAPRSCDEWHDGGGGTIALLQRPVIAVSTVSESYGSFTRALTAQPLSGSSFDAYGYTVDLQTGILTRRTSGAIAPFAAGRQNVHVTYTAGRTFVPANLLRATRRLVRWLWQTEQQGQRPSGSRPDAPTTTTPSGHQIPTVVKELCAGELRPVWGG